MKFIPVNRKRVFMDHAPFPVIFHYMRIFRQDRDIKLNEVTKIACLIPNIGLASFSNKENTEEKISRKSQNYKTQIRFQTFHVLRD